MLKIDGIEYTEEELVQAAELYPYTWALQHEIKTSTGVPFEFEKRLFMRDILNDLSPLQVILKPPQIGATETEIIKSFYVAKKLKRDIIYTLPTLSDVQDMAGGKINRLVAQNPILREWVKDHDTVEQKLVGDNIIYYRGTFTNKQAMMVSSGLNIHDEVDASDPSVITQYETRLQAQEDGGWRWYFSHPSLAGFGVDIYWQQSDKKEWYITCNECKKEQVLSWPDSISITSEEYVCQFCHKTLSTAERINGYWKATAEGTFSGFHVSQLMLYNKSASDIIAAYNDPMKDKQYFYNYVLGLPYIGYEDKISSETVLKNLVKDTNGQEGRIIIGVDTGLPIHYTILNQDGVFYYGKCKEPSANYDPYDELAKFLDRWPRSVLISDQGGDLIGIRKLQAKYSGRVFLCYYQRDRKTTEVIRWGKGNEYGMVDVDRNKMIQLVVEQLRDIGRIRLNGDREDWLEFAKHFDNIYREQVVVKEAKDKDNRTLYGPEYVWKRNGPDHYVHALLYALVGLDKYGQGLAKIVDTDEFSSLPQGRIFPEPKPLEAMGIPQGAFSDNSVEL